MNKLSLSIIFVLAFLSRAVFAQESVNVVDYQVTYDLPTDTYTVWVVPDYNTSNSFNANPDEIGATAQVTLAVPKDFNISNITDVRGNWEKGPLKLGPGQTGQDWSAYTLDPNTNYYSIGKSSTQTNYGPFAVGVPVRLFTFQGNGCLGIVRVINPAEPFIAAADNKYSLNVANSFYSRSGQPAGGNQGPLEQFRQVAGAPANCSNPIIGIVKTAVIDRGVDNLLNAGDIVNYTYEVTNLGNVPLFDVDVTESATIFSGTGGLPVPAYSSGGSDIDGQADLQDLALNASLIYTSTYTLTEADIISKELINQAEASGTPPATPVDPNPSPVTDLSDESSSAPGNDDPTVTPLSNIGLVKTSVYTPGTGTGTGTITYTYTVTNTGEGTLTNVVVAEESGSFTGDGTLPVPTYVAASSTLNSAAGTLLEGESATYTAVYTLTAADMTAGTVSNQAKTTATDVNNEPVEDLSDDNSSVEGNDDPTVTPLSNIGLVKTSVYTPGTGTGTGTITYTYTVTNTGEGTLTNVVVAEESGSFTGDGTLPVPTYVAASSTLNSAAGTLLEGESATYTAVYTLTAADMTAGTVSNQAKTTATDVNNEPVEDLSDDNSSVEGNDDPTVTPLSNIGLVKTSVYTPGTGTGTGTITYTYTVTNTGEGTLTNVVVAEESGSFTGDGTLPVPTYVAASSTLNSAAGTLLEGESATYTAVYTLTAADMTAGTVSNQAKTTATDVNNEPVEDLSDDNSSVEGNDDPTVTPLSNIGLVKTSVYTPGTGTGTGTITYTYTVTNTGEGTLTNVVVAEESGSFTGDGTLPVPTYVAASSTLNSAAGTLLEGESATYTAVYTLTAADMTAGTVSNQAKTTATDVNNEPVEDLSDDNSSVEGNDDPTVTPLSNIGLVKTSVYTPGTGTGTGTITYTYTVTNTGEGTLTNVVVAEESGSFTGDGTLPVPTYVAASSTLNSAAGTLLEGESATYTAVYTLTAADMTAGTVSNQAKTTATDVNNEPVEDLSDDNSSVEGNDDPTVTPLSNIGLVKTSVYTPGTGTGTGTITYTYTVTNTGEGTLTNVVVAEESGSFTGDGTLPVPTYVAASSTLNSAAGTLLEGESATYTAVYTLTAADMTAGTVSNQAKTTATDVNNEPVEDLSDDNSSVEGNDDPTVTPLSNIGLVKTSVYTPGTGTGTGTITYTYTVTNTGEGTLTNVVVAEESGSFTGDGTLPVPTYVAASSTLNSAAGTLLEGESATYTAVYTLTAADMTAGTVSNQAKTTATDVNNEPVEDLSDDNSSVEGNDDPTVTPLSNIGLVKTSVYTPGTGTGTGTITYTYTVTNTGEGTLTNVVVAEESGSFTGDGTLPVPTYVAASSTLNSAAGTLLEGESATYTAVYTLTAADMTAGTVSNQAKTTATDVNNEPVEDLSDDNSSVEGNDDPTVTPLSNIGLVKTSVYTPGTGTGTGTITYTYTVTNTGEGTLTNVVVAEESGSFTGDGTLPVPTYVAASSTLNSAAGTLLEGESATYTAVYTLTAADMTAGTVSNQAKTTATDVNNEPVEDLSDDNSSVEGNDDPTVTPLSNIGLVKTSVYTPGTGTGTGTITYTYTVTNTGEGTLTNVVVAEESGSFTGDGTLPVPTYVAASSTLNSAAGTLLEGESATYTAVYTLTAADMTAGTVSNQAKTTATDVNNEPVEDLSDDNSSVEGNDDPTVTPLSNIGLVKTSVYTPGTGTGTGTITYTYTVTNTGEGTLTNVVVAEESGSFTGDGTLPVPTYVAASSTLNSAAGTLLEGESATYTAVYTLTAADMTAGTVSNQAKTTATDVNNEPVEDLSDDNSSVEGNDDPTVTPLSNIGLVKTSVYTPGTGTGTGTITYTYTVTNTGEGTLTNVVVAEESGSFTGDGTLPVPTYVAASSTLNSAAGTLLEGESATYTAVYTLTAADMTAGTVSNQAKTTATDVNNEPVEDLSDDNSSVEGNDDPTVTPLSNIGLVKTSVYTPGTGTGTGTITYTYTVTNTGEGTLTNVVVAEESGSFTGDGTLPVPTYVAASSTLNSAAGTLLEGESATYTAVYTLTAADMTAGTVSNQAKTTATDVNNEPVEDLSDDNSSVEGNDDPTVTPLSNIGLVKTSVYTPGTGTGTGTITYTYTVTNTGEGTLTNVVVAEESGSFTGDGTLPVPTYVAASSTLNSAAGTLLEGESATYTAVYTLTAADMTAGTVSNQAKTTATDVNNEPVEDLSDDNSSVEGNDDPTVTPLSNIGLVKTSVYTPGTGTGTGTITYTYTVTNTGEGTLTNVVVAEESGSFTGDGTLPVPTYVAASSTLNSAAGTLLEGESATYTAVYTLTAADMTAGTVSNQAKTTATDVNNEPVEDLSDDNSSVEGNDDPTVTPLSNIGLVKTSVYNAVASTITYTYVVTNTGQGTLTNVTLAEESGMFTGTGTLPVPTYVAASSTLNSAAGTLLEGESATYTAVYNLTPADIIAGTVSNQAKTTATDVNNEPVEDLSDDNSSVEGNDDPTVTPLPKVLLLPKAWLQGSLFGVTDANGVMRDDLRVKNLIPLDSPYPGMGFTELTPSESIGAGVLAVTGPDAIVDWVFVELRDATDNTFVVDSRSALIQRDGDIVAEDGVSPVAFCYVNAGNYYVAVKHRNHLGVMSKNPIAMSSTATSIDFRSPSTPTFDFGPTTTPGINQAQVVVNQGVALWAGNAFYDNTVGYQGTINDVNPIYQLVTGDEENSLNTPFYKVKSYNTGDINMNGETIFQGTQNDVEFIYQNVIKNHPGNEMKLLVFTIREQLPENTFERGSSN